MPMTIHEMSPNINSGGGKSQILFCQNCRIKTLHTTPFFGYPFTCIANHGGTTRCDGCHTFVAFVAKIVVTSPWNYLRYCTLCVQPDSPQKQLTNEERRRQHDLDGQKLVDLKSPIGIADALGASLFR